ncbi:MAG: NAD(P)-binding domain-containing protein, partial [Clostridia bacterium]|nr:NAD(P)-binding domain-containing protein [Clostridia bacterium]
LPVTLLGLRVLVLGFGRVGFAVAELFKAAGCDVTVCARRPEQLARAQCTGLGICDFKRLCRVVVDADVVINTVPDTVVDANVLSFVSRTAPVIDLASMPGGVDGDAAAHFGVRVIHALSLPGKTAPVSAGGYIADAICSALETRGVV